MKLRTSLLALGAAALLIPGGAVAKSDKAQSKGKSGQAKGQAKAKNAVFKGSVVSVDAATGIVVVKVAKANKWGRRFAEGSEVAFDVSGVKKLGVRDVDGSGTADLADVAAENLVHVQAKITKDAAPPLAARKFKVRYPETEDES